MKKRIVTLLIMSLLLAFTAIAQATVYTDVIQTPIGYFVPTDAQKYNAPYYRWYDEDWGWTHNTLSGVVTSITTATLNISSFDVDYSSGERDNVYIWNNTDSKWDMLGTLTGKNDDWSYDAFNLGFQYFDEILAGLQVWVDIDSTHNYDNWALTLTKSVISIDGSAIPGPQPGAVPIPGAFLLLAPGLAGLAIIRKKMNL
ncbi:MAG: hypothetical protein ABFD75_01785 [Smithella sp.]